MVKLCPFKVVSLTSDASYRGVRKIPETIQNCLCFKVRSTHGGSPLSGIKSCFLTHWNIFVCHNAFDILFHIFLYTCTSSVLFIYSNDTIQILANTIIFLCILCWAWNSPWPHLYRHHTTCLHFTLYWNIITIYFGHEPMLINVNVYNCSYCSWPV